MPITKSAIKRVRQQHKRRSHNLQVKRAVHDDTRALLDAVAAADAKLVAEKLSQLQSEVDRAVKNGVLHKNTAARKKSRAAATAATVLTKSAPAKKAAAAKPAAKKPAAKATSKKPAVKPKAKPKAKS